MESVEVGYSDIFLEYSMYLTTRSKCLEYSDIYLEYVNQFPIPGMSRILSESFGNIVGIYLDYSSACESANAIGMPLLSQYTYFGCQGCLIFSAKRGEHACQHQSVSRCSSMWHSIDCDVAAAANPRKIS